MSDADGKIGIHDDFLNQLLYGIWTGRTLEMDLDAEEAAELPIEGLPLDLQGLKLEPALPFVQSALCVLSSSTYIM